MKRLIKIFILLLLLDSIYLYFIKDKYNKQIINIQKEPMVINLYSALIVYILISLGLYYINDVKMAFFYGIIIYGVYDFTNGAIFKNWNFNLAIIDTLWGGLLCGLTIYLTKIYL